MKIGCEITGRFGNQLFKYAYARALAEQQGHELHTTPWVGQKIFDLSDPPIDGTVQRIIGEQQHGGNLIYTRSDVKRWFKLKPEIEYGLSFLPPVEIACHIRWGDFLDLSSENIAISKESYVEALEKFGFGGKGVRWLMECWT